MSALRIISINYLLLILGSRTLFLNQSPDITPDPKFLLFTELSLDLLADHYSSKQFHL
ncbi:hypothetical protein L873DRAFT_34046 [Choiromyces venosus 120613-1]|uniref:Uncharacterized protein n=1 Tax=Choiromyces venosus 120613-1 TaxID=1336337 RepID=A0A3N4K9X1_9PEZI|nr:hypothetical protein L873DRAFT_34046 [Choiromyces venosus 120613-1]